MWYEEQHHSCSLAQGYGRNTGLGELTGYREVPPHEGHEGALPGLRYAEVGEVRHEGVGVVALA